MTKKSIGLLILAAAGVAALALAGCFQRPTDPFSGSHFETRATPTATPAIPGNLVTPQAQ